MEKEINKQSSIKNSDAYKLTTRSNREDYDQALKDAQAIYDLSKSTITQVKIATWRLEQRTQDLDGAKVHVKDINNLTQADTIKIYHVAYNANDIYSPETNYLININFTDHNHKLMFNLRHYSKATQDPKYLISNTTKELKISDYATEK